MDQCGEMRAQVERLCDGRQAASGTTQIQAISGSQTKSIRREVTVALCPLHSVYKSMSGASPEAPSSSGRTLCRNASTCSGQRPI